MYLHQLRRGAIVVAVALALLVGLSACESDDDDDSSDPPSISPASINISAGETEGIVFKVKGGKPDYAWSVADSALGSIAEAGETAIYTRTAQAGLNFVFVSDANGNIVTATINQL